MDRSQDDTDIARQLSTITAALKIHAPIVVSMKPDTEANLGQAVRAAMALARLLSTPVAISIGSEQISIAPTPQSGEDVAITGILDQIHAAIIRVREKRDR